MNTNTIKSAVLIASVFTTYLHAAEPDVVSLSVTVDGLRNSQGRVQFALYNTDDSIPDFDYEKYYRKRTVEIHDGLSSVVFNNLPKGRYAVNALHDENMNGKIDKGFILPIEGIGFTNYTSIGLGNRPNFSDASIGLTKDSKVLINIIYF